MNYEENIGKRVSKRQVTYNPKKIKEDKSYKPFKSGQKINTVKGVIPHPQLGVPAYTFEEDDSYVECRRCRLVDEIDNMSKEDIIEALEAGCTVSHRYFMSGEYVKMYGDMMMFEDGVQQSQEEFWGIRTNEVWNSGWSIIEVK
jgi:hypothetical protein